MREIQRGRFAGTGTRLNAEMGPAEVREHAQARLFGDAEQLLRAAVHQLALTARAFHRVLKVARTIADFDASEVPEAAHVGEAIQYRERVE